MLADDYYVALATVLAAMIPVILGIRQYAKGQVTQRQQILFDLINELNKSPEFGLAKKLLGYGYVEIPNKTKNPNGPDCYYIVGNLPFLKNYKKDSGIIHMDDPGELQVKESLDSFIVFLGKVGYSLSVGAIALNEIIYFQYWIGKTRTNKAITEYISNNEFPLYGVLVKELIERKPRILAKLRYRRLEEMRTLAVKEKWWE
jgi:hypothetical protein